MKKDVLYYQAVYAALVILKLVGKRKIPIPISWETELKRIRRGKFSGIEKLLEWRVEKYFPKPSPLDAEDLEKCLLTLLWSTLQGLIKSQGKELHSIKFKIDVQEVDLIPALKKLFAYLSATYAGYNEELAKAFYMGLELSIANKQYENIWKEHSQLVQKNLDGESLETKILKVILDYLKKES